MKAGEKYNSVVEDEIDTSELLHHLKTNSHKSTTDIAGTVGDGSAEAVGPAC